MIKREQRTVYVTSDNKEFETWGEAHRHEIARRLDAFFYARRACAGNDLDRESLVEFLVNNATAIVNILNEGEAQ